jgi:hypothetical protein
LAFGLNIISCKWATASQEYIKWTTAIRQLWCLCKCIDLLFAGELLIGTKLGIAFYFGSYLLTMIYSSYNSLTFG